MGIEELRDHFSVIYPSWDGKLNDLPESVKDTPFWQYGNGNHRSKPKRISGSVNIDLTSSEGRRVRICHLVISSSSPWVIGRNVTKFCDIIHRGGNFLRFGDSSSPHTIPLVNKEFHSFIDSSNFFIDNCMSINHPNVSTLCSSTVSLSLPDIRKLSIEFTNTFVVTLTTWISAYCSSATNYGMKTQRSILGRHWNPVNIAWL